MPKYQQEEPTEDKGIRLNRYLANSGVSNRREADKLIAKGLVKVNGKVVVEMGYRVQKGDKVVYEGEYLNAENKQYILVNKPKECTLNKKRGTWKRSIYNIIEYACTENVYPADQISENTTGVLLMTNDNDLIEKLNNKRHETYHLFLDKEIKEEDLQLIKSGIKINNKVYKAKAANYANVNDKKEIGIEIGNAPVGTVPQMMKTLGYNIVRIDRVLFNGLSKKNVPRGSWRFLSRQELHFFKML